MIRRLDPSKRAGAIVVALLLGLPIYAAAIDSTYLLTFTSRIVIDAIAVVALQLLVGRAGLVSFGHALYFGLGGYVVAIASFHLSQETPLLGWAGSNEAAIVWPLAMVVCAAAAAVFGAFSLRTSGVYFIMITLAFAQMLFFFFVGLRFYGGSDGLALSRRNLLFGMRIVDPYVYYAICLALLGLAMLLVHRLGQSRFGLVLRGGAASERRMLALGFPVYRYRLVACMIAGAIAGLAGALWADLNRFASPDMLSWLRSGEFLVMIVLGGIGSTFGAITGAAVVVIAESVLAGWTEHWEVYFGPLIVAIALFAPAGLWGALRKTER